MKKVLCFLLVIGISFSLTSSITECQCAQLLSKSDCKGTVSPPVVASFTTYC